MKLNKFRTILAMALMIIGIGCFLASVVFDVICTVRLWGIVSDPVLLIVVPKYSMIKSFSEQATRFYAIISLALFGTGLVSLLAAGIIVRK